MHSELLKVINEISNLSEEGEQLFCEIFKPVLLKKKEFFIKPGQRSDKAAFVRKGLVRYFVIKNDEESTLEFTGENEFVADHPSFTKRETSVQYIQAIEECELLVTSYDDLQRMYNELENGNLIGRIVLEHRFGVMMNQILSIYMHTPEQRYNYFIEQYGALAQRIPQYLIASYVGIKPQSLSRIRKRMTETNK